MTAAAASASASATAGAIAHRAATSPPAGAAPAFPPFHPQAPVLTRAASEVTPLPPPPMSITDEPMRPTSLAAGSSALAGDIAVVTMTNRVGSAEDVSSVGSGGIRASTDKRRTPLVFVAGGAAAVLAVAVIAIVMLRGGGNDDATKSRTRVSSKTASTAATSDRTEPETTAPHRMDDDSPGGGAGMRIDETTGRASAGASGAAATAGSAAATPDDTTPPAPVETTPATAPATPSPVVAPKRATPTLGGKKVVLEYDSTAPKETPKKAVVAKGDDNAAIGAARITYFNGNRKLFAGDADSAIKLYRQALSMYPGYVASYRGLGLAYAQKGDKANALKAFRTYINAVPGAKDIALIKQRISTLQR